MNTGHRLAAVLLFAVALPFAPGCVSPTTGERVDPFTAGFEHASGAIAGAFAPKLQSLAEDRDEALAKISAKQRSIAAQELATGVTPDSQAAYQNRQKEGQFFVDTLAPITAEYFAYRQELLTKAGTGELSEDESQALLQVTADLAALLDRWVAFNGAFAELQAVAQTQASASLRLTTPTLENFPREVMSAKDVKEVPGFENVDRSRLPAITVVGNTPPPNYFGDAVDGVNRTEQGMNDAQRRRDQAIGTWDKIMNFPR